VAVDIRRIVAIAEGAGALIVDARAAPLDVAEKGGAGPVTRADRDAERYLRDQLLVLHPCAWLGEETVDTPERLASSDVWIVDPLDGTKEFVRGLPEYTVSIALARSGHPVVAVIHNPATRETWWAERGRGAHGPRGRLRVHDGATLVASRTEIAAGEFDALRRAWTVEPLGSIAYKLALVATGRAAATLSRGPKSEWDVCAGTLLVEEAGGVVTDLENEPLRFNRPDPRTRGVVAGAPGAHARALRDAAALGVVRERSEERGAGVANAADEPRRTDPGVSDASR
jgi:myo-inositol-1(or 4)-monophosphatase